MNPPASSKGKTTYRLWLLWVALALIAAIIIIYFLHSRRTLSEDNGYYQVSVGLCHDLPYLAGASVLVGAGLLYLWFSKGSPFTDIFKGADQRLSASKFQFFLWSVVVIFAYASFFMARIAAGKIPPDGDLSIQTNLLLAMGMSITTALGAKGITVSYVNSGAVTKDHPPTGDSQASDLAKDDSGVVDLSKLQMLAWTLIALGSYLVNMVRQIHLGGHGLDALPDIDQALMVLMGLGHGTYLGKKLIVNTSPTIMSLDPSSGRVGASVTITGSNFNATPAGSRIVVDGIDFVPSPPNVTKWSDTSITFVIPANVHPLADRKVHTIGVVVGGQGSNTASFYFQPEVADVTVTALPKPQLNGSGFGTFQAKDQLKVNGQAVTVVAGDWTNQAIMFSAAGLQLPVPSKAEVRLLIDGQEIVYSNVPVM